MVSMCISARKFVDNPWRNLLFVHITDRCDAVIHRLGLLFAVPDFLIWCLCG